MSNDQRQQRVGGHQINIQGDADIDHIGDDISVEGGDYVVGDKIVHVHQPPSPPPNPLLTFERLPFEPKTTFIPQGTFIMGHKEVLFAAPPHDLSLPAFRIGVYPVTNREYAHFLHKTGRIARKEQLWQGNQPPTDQLEHPVSGVSWYDAIAYCDWLAEETKRPYTLPTEAHWERAARGTDGRFYPWGNTWQDGRCNTAEKTTAVNAYPPQTESGLYDLVGNVREWTTTLWGLKSTQPDSLYAYPWQADGRNSRDASAVVRRVVRRGRGKQPEDYNCCRRGSCLPDKTGRRQDRLGFRVLLPIDN